MSALLPRAVTLLTALLCTLAASCGTSMHYSCSPVSALDSGGVQACAVDIVDLRTGGGPLIAGNELADDLEDLRASVRKHLVRAKVTASAAPVLPAPTAGDLPAALDRAATNGGSVLLVPCLRRAGYSGEMAAWLRGVNAFSAALAPIGGVGLLPLIIVNSFGVNTESAFAGVEIVAVDVVSRELLGVFTGEIDFHDESVSGWGWDPAEELPPVVRDAVQQALESYAAAARSGFPNRQPLAADTVLLADAR